METDRRQQLIAAKLRAIIKVQLGDSSEVTHVSTSFSRGAACVAGNSSWVLVSEDPQRALGAALAWTQLHAPVGVELNLITEGDAGIATRRAAYFKRPIRVWSIKNVSLVEVPPLPLPVRIEAKGNHLALRNLIEEGGAELVVEHGIVVGEVEGLEVCRVLDNDAGESRLEVGVGAHDREAFALLHGHLPPVRAVKQIVEAVQPHRQTAIGSHPLNRIAAERLLRARVIRQPEFVGAAFLQVAEPPVARLNLKEDTPCVAYGRDMDDKPVVVVFAFGIDLEVVPFAADARAWIDPSALLVVAVPERDRHRALQAMADDLTNDCRIVGLSL